MSTDASVSVRACDAISPQAEEFHDRSHDQPDKLIPLLRQRQRTHTTGPGHRSSQLLLAARCHGVQRLSWRPQLELLDDDAGQVSLSV